MKRLMGPSARQKVKEHTGPDPSWNKLPALETPPHYVGVSRALDDMTPPKIGMQSVLWWHGQFQFYDLECLKSIVIDLFPLFFLMSFFILFWWPRLLA